MTNPFQKAMMATSIIYMVLGLILIIWPDQARQIICYLLGAAALLYGAYRIIDYFARNQLSEGGVQIGVALGIACAVLGLFLLFKANTVVAVLAGVIGVAVVIDSILRLQIALNLRRMSATGWLALLITALVTLVFGVLLLFNPFSAVKVATIVAGAALLVDGAFTLWSLLKTRSIRDRRTVVIK